LVNQQIPLARFSFDDCGSSGNKRPQILHAASIDRLTSPLSGPPVLIVRGKAMRHIVHATVVLIVSLSSGLAHGEDAIESTTPAKPRIYALVAAVGDQFTYATEVQSTGTHLNPVRSTPFEIPKNVLNRVVLNGLDSAINTLDPASQRAYFALSAARMDGIPKPKQESAALESVVAELNKMPERLNWYRILVATPTYESLAQNKMPGKIMGLGMFDQPLCQAECYNRGDEINPEPLDGVSALTSEDKTTRARTFVAPFSYINVWVLDPKTLEVLDRQRSLDHQKLAESVNTPRMSQTETQAYLARRIIGLVETSASEAVLRSDANLRRGEVEIRTIKRVPPDDATNESKPASSNR
jgi:hypothetical protein